MRQNRSKSMQSGKASFSSSFEVYAAIGGDPEYAEVDDLFVAASKTVLNIKSEESQAEEQRRRTRRVSSATETKISAEVEVIDCDKLDVYFGSDDGIICFSVVVTIRVTSAYGDLDKVTTKAENLALAADLAIANGEFMDTLQNSEAEISVLLMEKAPESSSKEANNVEYAYPSGEGDSNAYVSSSCSEDINEDYISSISVEKFDDDDDNDSSSVDPNDFDGFLEIRYREYLQDINRKEVFSKMNAPTSPNTILDYPSEGSEPSLLEIAPPYSKDKNLTRKTESKVKFNSVVGVKCILSRHEMTPQERFNYWCDVHDFSDKMLKLMTEKWHREESFGRECEEAFEATPKPDGMPVLPDIKQLLPSSDREGRDGYTYTISIRG